MFKIKRNFLIFTSLVVFLSSFMSCRNSGNSEKSESETVLTGAIQVLVDESVEPIVKDQLTVFESSYPNSKIELSVLPENQVVNRLIQDSAQVAILTRELRDNELQYFTTRGFKPRVHQFAIDAVALIIHESQPDSLITIEEIVEIMEDKGTRNLVFDNANSSTFRFIKELSGVEEIPQSRVFAVQSNPEVIRFVHDNPGTIGVIGLNWIFRPDSLSKELLNHLRVLKVKNTEDRENRDGFYLPTQSNLAERLYPLARPIYVINAQPKYGLGMGFSAFLTGDRGQRIILKSGLMPDSLPPREIIIRKK